MNIVCKPMSNNSQQQLELHWTGPEQTILDREVCSTTELPADRAQSLQYSTLHSRQRQTPTLSFRTEPANCHTSTCMLSTMM